MLRRSRITAITTTLLFMGAISGAFAGAVAMTAATLVYLLTLPSVALLGLGAGVGAMIGTLSLPVLAWAFLRHVPLRVAIRRYRHRDRGRRRRRSAARCERGQPLCSLLPLPGTVPTV